MTERPNSAPSPGPDTPTAAPDDTLQKQVRTLKAIVGILLAAFVVAAGLLYYTRHMMRPYAVVVDGKTVATLRTLGAAMTAVEGAEHDDVGDAFTTDQITRSQRLNYLPMPASAMVDSDDSARHAIASVLSLRVRAYVIVVDGIPSIGLPTYDAAQQTLSLVRSHFASMPPNAPIIGTPSIKQATTIDNGKSIPPSRTRTNPVDAAAYFWTPPPAKTYVIKLGDRGYTVAVRNHIAFTDFLLANAGRDMNKLHPGDIVNIQKMPPALTVIVHKRLDDTEPILPNAPPGESGKRHVVYDVTYTNGVETARDILTWQVLSKPRPQTSLY